MTLILEGTTPRLGHDWSDPDPGLPDADTHYTPRHALAEADAPTEPRRALPAAGTDEGSEPAATVPLLAEPRRAHQGALRALLTRISH